ncbi:alpha-glucuronidase family glycosyl hydrolase [Sphingomonas sp. LT1P40]|uniref:alpha-glucuronidase family glycosyl hydrolase n=1 Tax=Alteristakelama amylovorans TaxID=3096166 RepID=UPI002FCC67F4
MRGLVALTAWAFAMVLTAHPASAEDGYELWLRYRPLTPAYAAQVATIAPALAIDAPPSPTVAAATSELTRAFGIWLDRPLAVTPGTSSALLLCRRDRSCAKGLARQRGPTPPGAFRIDRLNGRIVVSAADDIGLLYGSFALIRHIQQQAPLNALPQSDAPHVALRMLDHWDNLDGSVERGYAGRSIFVWWRLPGYVDPRLIDYARANASIGINAVTVNNVNAPATFLTPRFIIKAKALADTLRPYGIRVFLSARFSAPRDLGDLPTADPLDPGVQRWWRAKADEIYAAIPDFGGFLVKANSEGQPGPQDYGRTHADGANMLARAVNQRGVVIWRAFVYDPDPAVERTMQAYRAFQPLDGTFDANVIVQVKNGPLDFQPREPISPLFGSMPRTQLGLELQITKEYLGFSTHLAYLAPLFEEALDTGALGNGHATLADIVAGPKRIAQSTPSLIAGVANIGSDRNWSGSHFDQANWYAFGRMAWNPTRSSDAIAREWVAQTFAPDPVLIDAVAAIMLPSRQTVVDYMTPLGLAHLMGSDYHFGPAPWVDDLARPDWNPVYYHRADADGIGVDRGATGSNALGQYPAALARRYADQRDPALPWLLWFHRKRWDDRLVTGRTVWDELVVRYDRGVAGVDDMAAQWDRLRGRIDDRRHAEVAALLAVQRSEAQWWRDASIAYFQSLSKRPLPPGHPAPAQPLSWYRAQRFPEAPGI